MPIGEQLLGCMEEMPVVNTHSHFVEPSEIQPYDLNGLLQRSYIGWHISAPEGNREARRTYLDKVRFNSYFVWLEKSLRRIYGFDDRITADNWDWLSDKILETHRDEAYSIKFLKDTCHYRHVVHDPHWNPQQANRYPGFFTPAYRVNMFLYGWGSDAHDHGGHNAQAVLGTDIRDIDEYVEMMRGAIARRKAEGCVALKSALAYDRELDFRPAKKDSAQKALTAGNAAGDHEVRDFQDYIFFELCRISAEFDMPFQNHTGLGLLRKTNAMQLHTAIDRNPDTKFVLFHGSYPWTDDIGALLHNYRNVYPDLCWLPIISGTACERLLGELIDVSLSDKVCWGCDTWTAEESLGALLAVRHALARVLSARIEDGYFTLDEATVFAKNVLHDNASKLYHLE